MANEKVRKAVNGGMSVGQALSQWVFRKVLHHDPLAVVDQAGSGRKSQGFKNPTIRGSKPRIEYSDGAQEVVYNMADGRSFRITVEQVS